MIMIFHGTYDGCSVKCLLWRCMHRWSPLFVQWCIMVRDVLLTSDVDTSLEKSHLPPLWHLPLNFLLPRRSCCCPRWFTLHAGADPDSRASFVGLSSFTNGIMKPICHKYSWKCSRYKIWPLTFTLSWSMLSALAGKWTRWHKSS
jgi:hypothetical protein